MLNDHMDCALNHSEWEFTSLERDAATSSLGQKTESLRRVVGVLAYDAYIHAKLNGYPLWLPRDTFRTMVHCAHWEADDSLSLWVEIDHLNWMMGHLQNGG